MSIAPASYREELAVGGFTLAAVTLAYGSGPALFMYTAHLFVAPIQAATGWDRGEVALGISLMLLVSAITLPLVGRLADRLGARKIGLLSFAGYAGCCALLAVLPPALWTYYSIMAGLAIFIPGSSAVVLSRPVTARFVRLRGTALAVMYSGTAIALAVITPTLVAALGVNFGRGYAILAVAALAIGAPMVWIATRQGDRPPAPIEAAATSSADTWRAAVGARGFWLLAFAILGSALGVGGLLNQLSSVLTSRGLDPGDVATMATLFAVAVLVGRFVVGLLLDLLNPAVVSAVLMMSATLAVLLLIQAQPSVFVFGLAVVLIGSAMGAEGDIAAFFTARLFGRPVFSTLFGGVSMFIAAGLATSGYFYGRWFDGAGDYRGALLFSAAAFLLSAAGFLAMMRLRPVAAVAP